MIEPPKKPALPDNWDPPAHRRKYVRSTRTGDLGYFVRRDGKDCIRLDRPSEEIVKAYTGQQDWVDEQAARPISDHQMGRVCFEADRALCLALGLHGDARREWISLTDAQRIHWMKEGPDDHPRRRALYLLLQNFLRGDE